MYIFGCHHPLGRFSSLYEKYENLIGGELCIHSSITNGADTGPQYSSSTHTRWYPLSSWAGCCQTRVIAATVGLKRRRFGSSQASPVDQDCQWVDEGGEEKQEREGRGALS